MGVSIFTIGHSNLALPSFIDLLHMHSIEMLCDIRSAPYSRFPHFNREKLAFSLEAAGIRYAFLGDKLGGRINDPACYLTRRVPERKVHIAELVDYEQLKGQAWFQVGIDGLMETARQSRTAVMCSEEDPARCHRHLLVARRLTELGVDVAHIRSGGRLEIASFAKTTGPKQPPLFQD